MKSITKTRPSPIAGQWYPGNFQNLSNQVDGYIDAAKLPVINGEIIAVMAPHAGYQYSGPVAGYAFSDLKGLAHDLVAVVSPMHHPYYDPLLTTAHSFYETPLGTIPVNEDALSILDDKLMERLGFKLKRIAYDPEHSLEIELPFLQRVIHNEFSMIPIMVREQSAKVSQALGESLAELLDQRNALLVASTDLSHFYPQNVAEVLDKQVLLKVEALDPKGVIDIEDQGKGFACGRGALAAVMWAALNLDANHAQILNYATSGSVTGDYAQVVGYGAAVITRN